MIELNQCIILFGETVSSTQVWTPTIGPAYDDHAVGDLLGNRDTFWISQIQQLEEDLHC